MVNVKIQILEKRHSDTYENQMFENKEVLHQPVAHSSEKNYMDHIQCTGGKHIYHRFFEEQPKRHPRIFPIWIPYYKIEPSNLRSKSKVKVHSGICSQKMSHVLSYFFCAGRENGFTWL